MVMYQNSEREEAARQRLHEMISELRESLLDLLKMHRLSNEHFATTDMPHDPIEDLRHRAREIELQDYKIRRARSVIDGTKDAEKLTGKLP